MIRFYGRQRRQLTPEETAANAKARADRARATMHCQCCGKRYLANTGTIAHHGYQRPGGGWQTSSCSGAKWAPFEVSRDRLGLLIEGLKAWEANAVASLADVQADRIPVALSIPDRSKPRDALGRHPAKHVDVTRDTFDTAKADHSTYFLQNSLHSFDAVKDRDVRHRQGQITGVRDEIKAQQARFDGWKLTHAWDGEAKTWKPIGGAQ